MLALEAVLIAVGLLAVVLLAKLPGAAGGIQAPVEVWILGQDLIT